MELDERDAIREYQEAKSYLPLVETVAGLAPCDFDQRAYPEYLEDRLAALDRYLKELKPYSERLIRAASLRQYHYEKFIKRHNRAEEPGHRAWRKEMNKLAIECRAMVEHWDHQYTVAFDAAVAFSDRQHVIKLDLSVKNIEYNAKEKPSKNTISRPRLADAEKKRRKKELKHRKREGEVMLKESLKEFEVDYKKIKQFHTVKDRTLSAVDAIAECEEYLTRTLLYVNTEEEAKSFDRLIKHWTITGDKKDKKKLFDWFMNNFYTLYIYMKIHPDKDANYKAQYLIEEFNAIYLYTDTWNGIACYSLIRFLYVCPELLCDLLDIDMMSICRPMTILISAIIWPWDCKYLIWVCKQISEMFPLSPRTTLIKEVFRDIYPDSFHEINTPYIEQVLSYVDSRTSALALYRIRDARVIPPNRDVKLFKSYFGYYPLPLMTDYWNKEYAKFLALVK